MAPTLKNREIKTLEEWENSNLDFDDYCPYPSEIDEELFLHFAEVVSPNFSEYDNDGDGVFQIGEAWEEKEGVMYYETFMQLKKKWFYIGILPDFNLIEEGKNNQY